MKMALFFLCLVPSLATAFIVREEYRSGREICLQKSEELKNEIGARIKVPRFYKNPELGTTEIYAFTLKPFDSNKPTLIYFTGGPGGSSRSAVFDFDNINTIFFEQRGISCSRPDRKEDFYNPQFYSSMNTAKDALAILNHFNVEKATIYGHSYGTVVATIFASTFSDRTKEVILEGVIYKGNQSLWQSERTRENLQNFFDHLPIELQDKILSRSNLDTVHSNWFSKIGNRMFLANNPVPLLKYFIEQSLELEVEDFSAFIDNFYEQNLPEEEFYFGDVTMGMIACQEISMAQDYASSTMVFDQSRKLQYDFSTIDRRLYCDPLKISSTSSYYDANHYPIHVPVFYFLGETDSSTNFDQGIQHFNNIAKGLRHALVMSNGGHIPNLGFLLEHYKYSTSTSNPDEYKAHNIQKAIFENIVTNGKVDIDLIQDFNKESPTPWRILD